MKKYNVISRFQDKNTKILFEVGTVYESDDTERVNFLQDEGYLDKEDVVNDEFPKHTGGGFYELSNGEKVKGKNEATAAEKEIKKSGE